ncbi:MAG TPA: FAD:protein FMN transferase [Planctomycetota bacterium]
MSLNSNCRGAARPAAALLLVLASGCAAATTPAGTVQRRLGAMGTWLDVEVEAADRATALQASEAAVRAVESAETRLSTWTPDGELARLNRARVGALQALSPTLAAELAAAFAWSQRLDGAFDPAVGPLVAVWDLRGAGRVPTAAALAAAREASGLRRFALRPDGLVRLHPGAALEEGGFGKGAGLDAALAAATAAGASRLVLDLGGQVLVAGGRHLLRLADPADRGRAVLALEIDAGSLATSGNAERGLLVAGRRLGHLLDPRTGAPAPDFGSLSVLAPNALAADCLSTALFVLGPDAALRFAAAEPQVEVLILQRDAEGLRARLTQGLESRLTALAPELRLQVFSPAPQRMNLLHDR